MTASPTGNHSTPLRRLARLLDVVDAYVDQTGSEVHETSDDTRRALIAAMGFDASTDAAATAALTALRTEHAARRIEPVRVVSLRDDSRSTLRVRLPRGASKGEWRLDVIADGGDTTSHDGTWSGGASVEIALPELPLGYHDLRLALCQGSAEEQYEQTLIVVPERCVVPSDLVGEERVFGVTANLYTVRSATNWGVGDFSDLGALAEWSASHGADFVGVNPLHALLNRGIDVGPYSPVSRLFRNPLYLDVLRVPELKGDAALESQLLSPEVRAEVDALRDAPDVRYEQVMAVKGLALDALYRVFVERTLASNDGRARAYREWADANEPDLDAFATWMTIAEKQGSSDWRTWPGDLRDPRSEQVERVRREYAHRVNFHKWVQFETERQLGAAAERARDAGMRVGLYQDLAIGVSPSSADAWANQHLFAQNVAIGAPPDPLALQGQNWGLPPLDPRAMRQNRYRYFARVVRNAFAHAGALRIDHVLGLFRLFWIPDGAEGKDGAYVRYPTNDLLGIIALESARHRAIVVGEDLGTVPPEVGPTLERWGMLSSKVLFFERDKRGSFKASDRYPEIALTTANTHDLATIAGFWEGRDIDLRHRVGLIDDAGLEEARAERDADRNALLRRLVREGLLPRAVEPRTSAELRAAIHAFLCRTPSALVGLSLDDLAGELDAVNVPGVPQETHRSWTRKMRRPLEALASSDDVGTALGCDARRSLRATTVR